MKRTKRETLKDSVELIGILAVVLSLLLVAYEVRQSNRIAQATTTYEIGRDVNEFNELGYSDPEFAELLIKSRDVEFEPTRVEALRLRLLANRFVNLWTIQEQAYRNGLLTDEQFAMTKADVTTVIYAFPALLPPWKAVIRDQPGLLDYVVLEPLISATSEEEWPDR